MSRFSSLQTLDMSHNDLQQISAGAFQSAQHSLETLILSNNQIRQVHDGALDGLTSLRTLDLSGMIMRS